MTDIRGMLLASMFGNTKQRNAWADFGWPDVVSFDQLYLRAQRNGVATAVVYDPPEICWQQAPRILQGIKDDKRNRAIVTPWETQIAELCDRADVFEVLKQADERQRIGEYSAVIIQIRGTPEQADWAQPLDRIVPQNVERLIACYQPQLRPTQFDTDPTSERYRLPIMYEYNEAQTTGPASEVQGMPATMNVHWTRVITFCERPVGVNIYGIPPLLNVFNDLLTIELLAGAGGQSFWKNAAGKMVFSETDPSMGALTTDERRAISDEIDDFSRDMEKKLVISGLKVDQLSSITADPKEHYNVAVSNVAAGTGIPKNRLTGSQTGVLAGDKDEAAFLGRMQSRRNRWCVRMVNAFVDWLIAHGALQPTKYFVEFDNLTDSTQDERFLTVNRMTEANERASKIAITTGTEYRPIFTDAEIREAAGFAAIDQAAATVDDDLIVED